MPVEVTVDEKRGVTVIVGLVVKVVVLVKVKVEVGE